MKVSVLTLGCKVNQAESSLISNALEKRGINIVNITESPDICIVNTCAVTAKSDYQSRQLIRKARKTGARILVTGCYAELNKDYVSSMPGVEAIIENNKKSNLINIIDYKASSVTLNHKIGSGRSRLFIKVQDGCNNSCSYCVIPMARGSSRSASPESIILKIEEAVFSGYNEIVLTGIHLGSYGADLASKTKLSDMLKLILGKTKIKRIRLSSLEIGEIDDYLLKVMEDKRVCRHLHIPLQSGDDKILRLMNRTYDTGYFLKKIHGIFDKFPDISIGTDIIVGFPGEEEPEFLNTCNIIKETRFSYIHIFPYSPRKGTSAFNLAGSVSPSLIKERFSRLNIINKDKKSEYLLKQTGRTLDVLIEQNNIDGTCEGTTGNYLKMVLPLHIDRGAIVYATVERVAEGKLFGTLL